MEKIEYFEWKYKLILKGNIIKGKKYLDNYSLIFVTHSLYKSILEGQWPEIILSYTERG